MVRTKKRVSRGSARGSGGGGGGDDDGGGDSAPRLTLLEGATPAQLPIKYPITAASERALSTLLLQSCPPGLVTKQLRTALKELADSAARLNEHHLEEARAMERKTTQCSNTIAKVEAQLEQLEQQDGAADGNGDSNGDGDGNGDEDDGDAAQSRERAKRRKRLLVEKTRLTGLLETYRQRTAELERLQPTVDELTEDADEEAQAAAESVHLSETLLLGAYQRMLNDLHTGQFSSTMASQSTLIDRILNTQAGGAADGDDDDDDDDGAAAAAATLPAAPQPIAMLARLLDAGIDQRGGLPKAARLGDDPGYADFRKAVHEARNPEDEHGAARPLPPARFWFDVAGKSTVVSESTDVPAAAGGSQPAGAAGAGSDSDSDIEIEVQAVKTSMRCPITLQPFQEPLTNRECGHSYEAESIKSMTRGRNRTQCPAPNCSKYIGTLYQDESLIRKLRRRQEREAMEVDEDEDGDGDGPDGDGQQQDWAIV